MLFKKLYCSWMWVGAYHPYGAGFRKCTDNTLFENTGVATIDECASAALAANSQFMQWTNNNNGVCRYGPTCDNIFDPTSYDWQIYIQTTGKLWSYIEFMIYYHQIILKFNRKWNFVVKILWSCAKKSEKAERFNSYNLIFVPWKHQQKLSFLQNMIH